MLLPKGICLIKFIQSIILIFTIKSDGEKIVRNIAAKGVFFFSFFENNSIERGRANNICSHLLYVEKMIIMVLFNIDKD